MRKAFTLIEVIFVIVVLAIVVTIGTEIIFQTYKSYLVERAMHRGSTKTNIVSNQIVNRLTDSIPNTVIARKLDGTFLPVEDVVAGEGDDYLILQWMSAGGEAFSATQPGWTELVDLDETQTTENAMKTPGSNLLLGNTIITNIYGNGLGGSAVFFPGEYTPYNIGYSGNGVAAGANILGISQISGYITAIKRINLTTKANRVIKEFYKIAPASYALVPTAIKANGLRDLELRYSFRPWKGESYNSASAIRQTIMKDIVSFRFMGTGSTLRFKLCKREMAGNFEKTICKEKAVVR